MVRWRIGTGTLGFQARIVLCRRILLGTTKIIGLHSGLLLYLLLPVLDLLNLFLEQQNLLLELPDLPLLSGFLELICLLQNLRVLQLLRPENLSGRPNFFLITFKLQNR